MARRGPNTPQAKIKYPNRVRWWRLRRDLTLEELAERSGTTPSQLGKVERGDLELRPSQVGRLMAALDCRSWELSQYGDEPDAPAIELLRRFDELDEAQRLMLLQMTRSLAVAPPAPAPVEETVTLRRRRGPRAA